MKPPADVPPAAPWPLRPLDEGALAELRRLTRPALALGVLWSVARRREVVDLIAGARPHTRVYLLGPEDLGAGLQERAWLKARAHRLLARRGVALAADLIIANDGAHRRGALIVGGAEGEKGLLLPLSPAQVDAAVSWFAHLFWHHAREEGQATALGYRFRPCPEARFRMPPLPSDAPLYLDPSGSGSPSSSSSSSPPGLRISADGCEVTAARPGAWSVRARLR